jgi:hypothetical protein
VNGTVPAQSAPAALAVNASVATAAAAAQAILFMCVSPLEILLASYHADAVMRDRAVQ